MKKYFFIIFTLILYFCFFPSLPVSALNETRYLRVINDETPFFADENKTEPLFYLPYTYYVKILEFKENSVHVELISDNFPSLDGYVNKDALFEDGLSVSSPYPSVYISTVNSCPFYQDKEGKEISMYVFANRTLYYYGAIKNSENEYLYYVLYNQKLGYVKENDVSPFTIPNHPNELTFIKSEPETKKPQNINPAEQTDQNKILKIVIICSLILAGGIALVIALTPKKKKTTSNYYDENDYE